MTKKIKLSTFLLSLSIFFTGAAGLINEYLLSTISIYILGNSIEQFSITIAIMLGMMGLGGYIQKFIRDDFLIEKFMVIEILLLLLGSFSPIAIYMAFAYMDQHFSLIQYFLISATGFLIGFEIPFIIRINEKYVKKLKANLSFIISADYFGSFIGAIIWVKLLLPRFDIMLVGFIVSGTNFFIAIITFLYFYKMGLVKHKKIFVFIFAVLVLFVFGLLNFKQLEVHAEQRLYKDRVVFTKTTKYQHITLTYNRTLNEHRLYINGNNQFSSLDEYRYHELLVHPAMSILEKKKKVLILGGGDGLATRELQKYEGIDEIRIIDLDPEMTELAKTHPVLKKLNKDALSQANVISDQHAMKAKNRVSVWKEAKRGVEQKLADISIVNMDADLYLNTAFHQTWDLILIDLPDPNSIELNKLYTKEFYMKLKRIMNKNSVLVMQATSPFHAKEAFLCIGRTLRASGFYTTPYHYNIPSFGDWGFYMASITPRYKEKIKSLQLQAKTVFLTEELFHASLIFGKNELHSDDQRINTLMRPILFHIYNKNSWLKYQ